MGYGLSLVIGIPLGLLQGRIKFVQDTVGTLVLGLQALPSICWPRRMASATRRRFTCARRGRWARKD